jgi:hypothetical protein
MNKSFVVLVSYFPGLDMRDIIKLFTDELELTPLFLHDLELKSMDEITDVNYSNIKSKIEMNNGYVIFGYSFPVDKLTFKSNIHINIQPSFKMLSKSNKLDSKLFEQYREKIKNNVISKYINIKNYDKELLDILWLYIIHYWEKNIYGTKFNDLKTKIEITPSVSSLAFSDTDSSKKLSTSSENNKD